MHCHGPAGHTSRGESWKVLISSVGFPLPIHDKPSARSSCLRFGVATPYLANLGGTAGYVRIAESHVRSQIILYGRHQHLQLVCASFPTEGADAVPPMMQQ